MASPTPTIEATVTMGLRYVRAEWREVLGVTNHGPCECGCGIDIASPIYGRVLATSPKLPLASWRVDDGETASQFVTRILGPAPEGD